MSLKAEDRNILIRREFQKAVDTMQEAKYCANGNLWKADYQNTYNLSSKEGTEYLIIAEEFLNKIETYLIDANRIENNPNNGKDREDEA